MKVRLIKNISRTLNLGNFNSIRIENGVESEVELLAGSDEEIKEQIDQAEEKLYGHIRRATANDLRRIREERKASKEESQ